ncbi:hypothetical protein [[Clostridium] polysaccharolyticum]|uniref:Uncharacterized protein n=1 Tax=[Clostridium] polysaccharolyticum TaxID=29364 RepID=A0A1I0ATC7_9FIRM|nr:hypothetical protein [[Clostridium] polysaccharolyticum]SES97651.1 hypothetical protein SAMN04487772_10634 [[Clostridium] polysaccharolyticum]
MRRKFLGVLISILFIIQMPIELRINAKMNYSMQKKEEVFCDQTKDEEGRILNEIHTDGVAIEYNWKEDQISSLVSTEGCKSIYMNQGNGEIIERSYFNNKKICDKKFHSKNILSNSNVQYISTKQKLKEYNSKVK